MYIEKIWKEYNHTGTSQIIDYHIWIFISALIIECSVMGCWEVGIVVKLLIMCVDGVS